MKNLDEKIKRFGILCKKGYSKGLTQVENKEFKALEKAIGNVMLSDEEVFDSHIKSFREAIKPLERFGFDLTK